MNTSLEQAIDIALKLSPQEQAQLLEQLASHLANQVLQKVNIPEEDSHWGQKVWSILEQLDTTDWQDVGDPVAWVKEQRRQSQKHFNLDEEA